nr:fused isobutyryl-CoA mutase/GTPase IcmF [Raineyella fluvialis]
MASPMPGQDPDALHVPTHHVRFVTAAALFDGHDAAINIIRRILQAQGVEVVHLGHDRSVDDVVTAAIQEDVQGVAISSYQGGHLEYFGYLVEQLRRAGAGHVRVFGGGGGVIVAEEVEALARLGVRIFTPADGQRLGLPRMVNELVRTCDVMPPAPDGLADRVLAGEEAALARTITLLQDGRADDLAETLRAHGRRVPVLGVSGVGGSGKSSLVDELVVRLRRDTGDTARIAVIAIDPSRARGTGALLGDRIRMNALAPGVTFFRSLATRDVTRPLPAALDEIITACAAAGHDLVIIETPGVGQGDVAIVDHADVSLYVMTPEYGSATQLEKIALLERADAVAINKFDRRGAEDALRDVARQVVRNREAFGTPWQEMPVFGTRASAFDDDGTTALYHHLVGLLREHGLKVATGHLPTVPGRVSSTLARVVPRGRERHLAEVAEAVRDYHAETRRQVDAVRAWTSAAATRARLDAPDPALDALVDRLAGDVSPDARTLLDAWASRTDPNDDRDDSAPEAYVTLSGLSLPRIATPGDADPGALLAYLRTENLPGHFPFTAGVFASREVGERPTRMFAGEGDAARTNRRFHLLADGQPTTRLSTAFDSVTLYGRDPAESPDVLGKVGTSGVSIATLDDMRDLFAGFDLCAPTTSVSMTINGPAPTILAMFLNAALDQRVGAFEAEHGRGPTAEETADLAADTWRRVRGTVQADILKEDQAQNTCIFSTDFSLRVMTDVEEWFVSHGVRHFYSASVSGYHIAEAGANPITQLAFTLANGLTYVEAYRARGLSVDDVAPHLSFFFSNGMDAEYTVIGRVARRIWAIAMRDVYGAGERAQKLKYHIQTSGRSLHAQNMDFNDIRTTLQALCAVYDNANSLHTNAYDEAVTTPSAESVRRALAIQLIIESEWGLAASDNPLQGSYVVEQLTDLVEAEVLAEFERLADRGGVLGAMETGYQRGRIQDESMAYEQGVHAATIPVIGVNTFVGEGRPVATVPLARGTTEEKASQLARLADFHARHAEEAPAALARLKEVATSGGNVFEALMEAVRSCSLGQISQAFFEVGGRYRRGI